MSLHFQHFFFQFYSISLLVSVMLSIYAKLSSHVLVTDRESGYKHARNWVYISKIENSSYHHELEF